MASAVVFTASAQFGKDDQDRFRVWGLGCGVQGSGFRVWGLCFEEVIGLGEGGGGVPEDRADPCSVFNCFFLLLLL